MRFKCVKCDTKYRIEDDRVSGRAVRVRCRNCGTVLKVRDPTQKPVALPGTRGREASKTPKQVKSVTAKTLLTRVATPADSGAGQSEPSSKAGRPMSEPLDDSETSWAPTGGVEASRSPEGGITARDEPATREEPVAAEEPAPHEEPEGRVPTGEMTRPPRELPEDGWFRVLDGKPEGPYSLSELVLQAAERRLRRDDLVWQPDWTQWQGASTVDILRRAMEASPPPPPPPGARRRQTIVVSDSQVLPADHPKAQALAADTEVDDRPVPHAHHELPEDPDELPTMAMEPPSELEMGRVDADAGADAAATGELTPDADGDADEEDREENDRRPQFQVIAGGRRGDTGPTGESKTSTATASSSSEDLFSDGFFADGRAEASDLGEDELQALEAEARQLETRLRQEHTPSGPLGRVDRIEAAHGPLGDFDMAVGGGRTPSGQPTSEEVERLRREFSVVARLERQKEKQKWLMALGFVGFFALLALGLTQMKAHLEKRDPSNPAPKPVDVTGSLHQQRYEKAPKRGLTDETLEVDRDALRAEAEEKERDEEAPAAAGEGAASTEGEADEDGRERGALVAAKRPSRRAKSSKKSKENKDIRERIERAERMKALEEEAGEDGKRERMPTLAGAGVLGRAARPLTKAELDRVMKANASKMQSCKTEVGPQKIRVKLRVGQTGLVEDVNVRFAGASDPDMARCLERIMGRWLFEHDLPKPQSFDRTLVL